MYKRRRGTGAPANFHPQIAFGPPEFREPIPEHHEPGLSGRIALDELSSTPIKRIRSGCCVEHAYGSRRRIRMSIGWLG